MGQRQIVLLVMASLGLGILFFTAGWLVGDIFRISETLNTQKKTLIRSQRTLGYKPKASVRIIKQKVPAIPKPQPEPVAPPAEEKPPQEERVQTEKTEEVITETTIEEIKETVAEQKLTQPAPMEEPAPATESDSDKKPIAAITPPPAGPLYAVQVGAFLSQDNADRFMRRLNQKDYQAYIFQVTGAKKRVWHAVRIGSYQDLEAARSDAAAFKDKEKMPAIVMYFDSLNPVYLKKAPRQQ